MSKQLINNINKLEAELKARQMLEINILGLRLRNKFKILGCSESEILEIESKYGKLPLSYCQILGLTGHNFDWFTTDLKLYKNVYDSLEQLILANQRFWEEKEEAIADNDIDDDILKVPENIFIINSHHANIWYILTDKNNKKDSPVYYFYGKIQENYSSVWGWISDCITDFSAIAY